MAANTRNADILFEYQVDKEKLTLKRRETVDLDKAVQIPDYCYVLERFLTLKEEKVKKTASMKLIVNEVQSVCRHANIVRKNLLHVYTSNGIKNK